MLSGLWRIDAATVNEANSHRFCKVGIVAAPGLFEQQRIADAFLGEGLLPIKVNAGDAKIWRAEARLIEQMLARANDARKCIDGD